ncbi:MAG: alpha-galactosidase GalA [Rhodobacteraceae bacterium HLUCCA08]|nr:MAG: alpha-galactosidase GalA [Rhodobacteraceae bacterium HLUCCA08]
MTPTLISPTHCHLGEGPLWHPGRGQLFWFDILGKRLLTIEDGRQMHWELGEHGSAAGWIDDDTLLIATETGLDRFDIATGARTRLTDLEADDPLTRSNDGRADPWSGFWIGTMAKDKTAGAGAIYRYYRGELRRLHPGITIPNSICFAPDRPLAYFADTPTRRVMRQPLDPETGWPVAAPEVFLDLRTEGLNPDGAVTDAEGCLWSAQWGASRVARYSPAGAYLSAIGLPTLQVSCPAFGGADLKTLFATTASEDHEDAHSGQTFAVPVDATGLPEPRVIP